ncbi:TetR/AcrR family transcriptional regulator [Lactococcus insecticola]|uniref:AcrR family transcriptional regulator n=1 Tax=Pseudolactococcus insecticola TaxID=2709158 RepID=A0A6A0B9E5_9LACT|nr:TetR/AcrR family transcriptional regulator [Lactococcus insecticola]GFH41068.1 AcrR family transcriptional regulator [Lactococcus insecticola]
MRKIDPNKIAAITSAVLDIVKSDGIVNLSMGKVAKLANVSPRTIYIYYDDKADLLGQMYLSVKHKIDGGLSEKLAVCPSLEAQLAIAIRHFAYGYNKWPRETIYMNAIQQNPELISPVIHEKVMQIAQPIFEMYEKMQLSPDFKHLPIETFTAIAAGPMNMLIAQAVVLDKKISDQEISDVIKGTQDAVRA